MALYIGIDVSKDKFDACGIGESGKKGLFSHFEGRLQIQLLRARSS